MLSFFCASFSCNSMPCSSYSALHKVNPSLKQITNCITKIDEKAIDDAEDLDLVMRMYNLTEYSSRYSETTGSLWSYPKDEATNFNADIANDNNFKCFMYKASLLEDTEAGKVNGVPKNVTTASP